MTSALMRDVVSNDQLHIQLSCPRTRLHRSFNKKRLLICRQYSDVHWAADGARKVLHVTQLAGMCHTLDSTFQHAGCGGVCTSLQMLKLAAREWQCFHTCSCFYAYLMEYEHALGFASGCLTSVCIEWQHGIGLPYMPIITFATVQSCSLAII